MEPLGIPDRTAAMLTRCLFSQLALLSPKSGAETMLPPAMSHRSGDALIARPPRWANHYTALIEALFANYTFSSLGIEEGGRNLRRQWSTDCYTLLTSSAALTLEGKDVDPLGIPDRTAAMLTRCLFSQLLRSFSKIWR